MTFSSAKENRHPARLRGRLAETPCAEITIHMAIASPKKKDELAREFKINPDINARLEAFMKAEPDLVKFVKELPREQFERKFLLRKMQDQQRKQGYDAKVKAWLERPQTSGAGHEPQGHHQPRDEA
jgi:hypothetical protein